MNTFSSPRAFGAAAMIALSLTLGACAGGYGAGNASTRSVGQASTVYTGTVTSVREVIIKPDRSIVGTAAGAVLGGIAGSEIGQGDKAETAGAIGGAVIGGVAGNAAGKALGTSRGYAYIVRFDKENESKEIVQGADVYIQPGTPVNIIAGADGWKIIPR
jgi:outer membrane lipoprotein SlyB